MSSSIVFHHEKDKLRTTKNNPRPPYPKGFSCMPHVRCALAAERQPPAPKKSTGSRTLEYTLQILFAVWFLFMMVIAPIEGQRIASKIEGQRSMRGAFFEAMAWVTYVLWAIIVREIFAVARKIEISRESDWRLEAVDEQSMENFGGHEPETQGDNLLDGYDLAATGLLDNLAHSGRGPTSPTTMEPPPPPSSMRKEPSLPVDVMLEIVALSDLTTAVRCAATSTLLRNAMLDPDFRHRLDLRAANKSASSGGFDPARLLAVSYSSSDYGGEGVVELRRAARRARVDAGLLRSFPPVSSRDGLLVLFREKPGETKEMRVCNAFTGHVTVLPHMDVLDHEFYGGIYRPALLDVSDAGRSFEVLVMDAHLRVQIFSSKKGCGAVRLPPPDNVAMKPYALQTSPAIIGRTVHYLCHRRSGLSLVPSDDMFVLAVHADAARAEPIELPVGFLGPGGVAGTESVTLAITADGKLSVLVADAGAIRVWALSPSPVEDGWSRRAVIGRRDILKQLAPGVKAIGKVVFQGFGERSGAVLLRMDMVGLVLLDLETGKAVLLRGCKERDRRVYQYEQAWLHEIDLASLLQSMVDVKKDIKERRRRRRQRRR